MQVYPAVWEKTLILQGIIRERAELYTISANIHAGTSILAQYVATAKKRNYSQPLKKAMTWYLGGNINDHWQKYTAAVGQYTNYLLHIN